MKKLCIIIPYRKREEHLKIFINEAIPYIKSYDFEVLVVEQFDEKPFNRGKLFNVGFDFVKDSGFDYFCFHDVDMIPIDVDYSYPEMPYHLVGSIIDYHTLLYPRLFGGVNIFNKNDFNKINGFSNEFWGWGGEDDDLLNRVEFFGFSLKRRNGKFKTHKHEFTGPKHPNYKDNLNKLKNPYDYITDGLSTLKYTVVDNKLISEKINHLKVIL